MALSKRVRRLLIAALLTGLFSVARPWLALGWYSARLAVMPSPAALPMPLPNMKPGALADTWQAPRAPRRRHEGIDIFAKKGTPVLATTEGIVFSRGQDALGGNVVWVYGPGGQRHYYAHLDQFSEVRSGDRVRVGTLLGYVGNTGNARTTPAHLHYGVYTSAGAINPYPLLAVSGASQSPSRRRPALPSQETT
jgi:murein DD-endopeptidase MepM/ murein hydrolase activator NlpD